MHANTFVPTKRLTGKILPHIVWMTVLAVSIGCQPKNEYQEPPPPTVTVANPVLKTVVQAKAFTGTTEAVSRVDLRARVEGFLDSIDFTEGQEVSTNDLLFTIDPRPFEASLAQAEASVQLAHAQVASGKADENRAIAEVANANAQLARAEKAAASGAITASEIDVLKTAVLTARAGVEAAKASITSAEAQIAAGKAQVTQAKLNLDYTKVRAPIDGRVSQRHVDIGNLVGSGESTLLAELVQYDPIYAFFTIDENDLLRFNRQHLEERNAADAEAKSTPAEEEDEDKEMRLNQKIFIGLGDEQGFPHEGVADYADLGVDQSTGTFLIRAVIPNPDRLIPPGAFIRVQVPQKEIEALLIDERAIGRDQAGAYLLVVDSKNVVDRRVVTVGETYDGLQMISGPISAEDRVIVRGLQRARQGAVVSPQELTADQAKPVDDKPADAQETASQDGEK